MNDETRTAILNAAFCLEEAIERLNTAYEDSDQCSRDGITIDRIRTISHRHAIELRSMYKRTTKQELDA